MRNSECGMMNAEREARFTAARIARTLCAGHSSFIIHHSAFRCRRSRRGVSILEVMFAILVTVVGLLGAVAVFPAASAMARKGRITDASAAAGRSAFHDLDVRGMRKPDSWLGFPFYWHYSANNLPFQFTTVHLNRQKLIQYPDGTAFCIDPRMIAMVGDEAIRTNNAALNAWASNFPAFPAPPAFNHLNDLRPRMFRITLPSGLVGATPSPMGTLQADGIFTFDDDLAYQRPMDDRSKPAEQRYDYLSGNGPNAKRLADGHFSWMATLVPKVEFSQRFLPGGAGITMVPLPTDEYVLSIVVYHDRIINVDPTIFPLSERVVTGYFGTSDGSTGGEVQLLDNNADNLKLRPQDWVMLSGYHMYRDHNNVNRMSTVPAFQWYRVTSCDTELDGPVTNPTGSGSVTFQYGRYATLMGQDWDGNVQHPTHGAAWCQATIVDGVVAVFEKTVRLEY